MRFPVSGRFLSSWVLSLVTAWLAGTVVRVGLTCIFIIAALLFANFRVAELFLKIAFETAFYELIHLWPIESSGDLVYFRFPLLAMLTPFVVWAAVTLAIGFATLFLIRQFKSR